MKSKLFEYAGVLASVVLIALGIGSLYIGVDGRDSVRDDLAAEKIVGTPDSTSPASWSTPEVRRGRSPR